MRRFERAERRKLKATRLSRGLCRGGITGALHGALAVWLLAIASPAVAEVTFKTPRAALEQGVAAWRTGNLQIAIPALEFAVSHKVFPAKYFLARVYADNSSAITDHPKAFRLLHSFIDENADTDPADYRRAPTFVRALTRLGRYIRDGLPEIGLYSNPERAVEYFQHAATFSRLYSDEDAQFELAKLQLTGEGIRRDKDTALHWLSVLSMRGHPGAQAFLADLDWRGKYTKHNPIRALSLITLALENAPREDRIWIEDIHQKIFCGADDGIRSTADGMVANWRQKFGRSLRSEPTDVLPFLDTGPQRTCANGELVRPLGQQIANDRTNARPATSARPNLSDPGLSGQRDRGFYYGGAAGTGSGYRETGTRAPRQ